MSLITLKAHKVSFESVSSSCRGAPLSITSLFFYFILKIDLSTYENFSSPSERYRYRYRHDLSREATDLKKRVQDIRHISPLETRPARDEFAQILQSDL